MALTNTQHLSTLHNTLYYRHSSALGSTRKHSLILVNTRFLEKNIFFFQIDVNLKTGQKGAEKKGRK